MIDKILKEALEEILKETVAIALPVENLARYQEQCDMDGVMVKVSRQALDQTLAAIESINNMAVVALDVAQVAEVEPIEDQWFVDRSLPIMAMSGDIDSDRVIKLHYRKKVTDKDRADLIEVLNAGTQATHIHSEEI
jgi:hypothetical protein